MTSSFVCNYSTRGSVGEQFKHFVLHTGRHAIIAMGVNALFMYLLGEEDLLPGAINGGATALSINATHKFVCCVWPKETSKDSGSKKSFKETLHDTARLTLLIFVNYIVVCRSYEFFDYHLKTRNLIEQTVFSYIGILGMTKYLKAQANHRN